MSFYQEVFNNYLDAFSLLYVQVGRLELTLRSVIPKTIRRYAGNSGGEPWFTQLIFDLETSSKIRRALASDKNRDVGIENLLPLSFWNRLFLSKNYEKLWIPYLQYCFPNLKNRNSKRKYREVQYLFIELNRIRNQVAHYNFSNFGNLSRDIENLKRLQLLLGLTVS